MLLQFKVKNFRSIRDEAVLSMLAMPSDKVLLDSNCAQTGIKALPLVLRSAVIYGANASGKTSFVQAMGAMQNIVAQSASMQVGQPFNIPSFKLVENFKNQETEFEITFLLDGIRHQYGFSLTSERILSEWLLVYKAFKPQSWINRNFDSVTGIDEIEIRNSLIGPKAIWKSTTRSNALLLSTAAQLNSEKLKPVFAWLSRHLLNFGANVLPDPAHTTQLLLNEATKTEVLNFISAADTGIDGLQTVQRKMQTLRVNANGFEATKEEVDVAVPQFTHKSTTASADFEFYEESQGTQKLFQLIAPVFDVLKNGFTLIVDELDNSLHPLMVNRLIALFHNPVHNKNGAQLIFTTHDTSLLDTTVFRRDQIWFTEKDSEQVTKLFPLSNFSPRKNEALEKGYLLGRYGGVPFFDKDLLSTTASAEAV